MYTAQKTRKENIAEYILYLWQLEDLLRALQFSPEAVHSQLIAPRDLSQPEQRLYLEWYMDIADLLRQEGFSEEAIASVHLPIGLPILAQTPAEIAISIAGEMIRCRAEAAQKR